MNVDVVEIGPEPPVYAFARTSTPHGRVAPGGRARFVTTDEAYCHLSGEDLDSGRISLRLLNAIAGPVFVEGAEPGDALVATIEAIELGKRAFVPYVARWRSATFGITVSSVASYPIRDGFVELGRDARIRAQPMVGCAGVAPEDGEVSTLGPPAATGGNLDLVELRAGAALWLPVQVEGALFALGDLHAAMGRGEPTGAGLECAGAVTVQFALVKEKPLRGPRIESPGAICFVGTHRHDVDAAVSEAVRAAWDWLISERNVDTSIALTLCSALLEVNLGGPAGANAVATFDRARLAEAGVEV
jgi:amidase